MKMSFLNYQSEETLGRSLPYSPNLSMIKQIDMSGRNTLKVEERYKENKKLLAK